MQYLTKVLDFVLQTEKDHYLESLACEGKSCLEINWIKENE